MTEDSAATGAGDLRTRLMDAIEDWRDLDDCENAALAEEALSALARLRAENASMADGMVALVTLHDDALRAKDAEIERLKDRDQIVRDLVALCLRDAKHLPKEKRERQLDYFKRKNILPSPFRAALKEQDHD